MNSSTSLAGSENLQYFFRLAPNNDVRFAYQSMREHYRTTLIGDIRTYQNQKHYKTPNHLTTTCTYQIMAESSLTTLIDIGDEIQGTMKWSTFVDGENGFFYGIPSDACRVVKFNPLDKSLTEIGPDFGERYAKWMCGVLANTGSIYCAPFRADQILKINTNDGTVETLDNVNMPETRDMRWAALWASGALAQDNTIYYMPHKARRIMRLNPDNDSLSSVGDDLGRRRRAKYSGTVVGNDYCLYGIPDFLFGIPDGVTRILKFDPTNPDITSTVGEEDKGRIGNGVLGCDGDIYSANYLGQVLYMSVLPLPDHNS